MELILLILLSLRLSAVDGSPLSGHSVIVEEGETAILPLKVDLPEDSKLSNPIIKWKTEKQDTVHQYWVSHDYNEYQIEHYKNRTSLFKEEIIKGNVSLQIRRVTKRDEGKYICEVLHEDPYIEETYKVSLWVKEKGGELGDAALRASAGFLIFGAICFGVYILYRITIEFEKYRMRRRARRILQKLAPIPAEKWGTP